MFEVPDAKRVRRQDLYDSASERDSTPDAEGDRDVEEQARIRARLNARLVSLLPIELQPGGLQGEDDGGGGAGAGDAPQDAIPDEFEFRLFSTSKPSQKVVLATEEEIYNGPAISSRPITFYLRGELSPEERARYRFAAVSASDVLAEARKRAWGLEVPWRVTGIASSARHEGGAGAAAGNVVEGSKLRKRPGKKRRIKIRTKEKAKKEAAAAAEGLKMTKEEHLREKKKRLNREKKLKRRQKEKEKKLAAKGGGQDGGGGGDMSVDGE